MTTEVGAGGMDIDEVKEVKGKLFLTFITPQNSPSNGSLGVTILPHINFTTLTLGDLKDIIIQDSKSPSNLKDGIDILYKAQIITGQVTSTLQHLKMKPNSIVNVVKRFTKIPNKITDSAASVGAMDQASGRTDMKKFTADQLHQVSMALRTGFIHPSFPRTIKKLAEPEMLENVILIAPQLATDSIGLAIIQTPSLIYFYTEMEPMKKLADERPWVIDAFNFIAAAIHQDKSSTTTGPHLPRGLVVSELLGRGEVEGDEDMDEDDLSSGNNTPRSSSNNALPRSAQSQPNIFTRELVEQAIRSAIPINIFGSDPVSAQPSSNVPQGSPFPPQNPSRPWTAPAPTESPISSQMFQHALSSALNQPQQSSSNSNPESADSAVSTNDVARAIMDAVNNLTPEARTAQLNFLRDRIRQMSGTNPDGTTSASASAQPTEYHQEIRQMREIGIVNESLALQALRVSDGDVGTASDLIFSGWNGEGAEDEHHQEE